MDDDEINAMEADGLIDRIKSEVVSLQKKLNVDSVQIFVTRVENHFEKNEASRLFTAGSGNWYTRYGAVKSWVIREEKIEGERL